MLIKCPKCQKEIEYEGNPHRPFCSPRCKTNDLGDWASGKYFVATEDSPSQEKEDGSLPDSSNED